MDRLQRPRRGGSRHEAPSGGPGYGPSAPHSRWQDPDENYAPTPEAAPRVPSTVSGADADARAERPTRPLSPRDQERLDSLEREGAPRRERQGYAIGELKALSLAELTPIAASLGVPLGPHKLKKNVVLGIMTEQARRAGAIMADGVLEIMADGYGFLRSNQGDAAEQDVYVSQSQVRRFDLRTGDAVLGQVRFSKDDKYAALLRVDSINYEDPAKVVNRPHFSKLIPVHPDSAFSLEVPGDRDLSTRVMGLFCPIGKGQRGLLVAPPKAGKTTLLKNLANAIVHNHPDVEVIVLLIDERPEEVTDMQRSVDGEVVSSTFDEPLEHHIRVSEMILEKAKRLCETGRDVVILLDSITRLARAYNLSLPSTGQTLSGGVNPAALYRPKKFFGAARNIENGGSLTILATALVDTGSRLDDVIFEEFKGTGNLELILDRKLFEKRLFPCIDIKKSGTRKEELLLEKDVLSKMWILRKVLDPLSPSEIMQLLVERMGRTATNAEFLSSLHTQAD